MPGKRAGLDAAPNLAWMRLDKARQLPRIPVVEIL